MRETRFPSMFRKPVRQKARSSDHMGTGASENTLLPLLFPQKPRIHRLVCFSTEIIKDVDKKKRKKGLNKRVTLPTSLATPPPLLEEVFFTSPVPSPRRRSAQMPELAGLLPDKGGCLRKHYGLQSTEMACEKAQRSLLLSKHTLTLST